MARIAAKHILVEETHSFVGADMSTKLKLMGAWMLHQLVMHMV